MAVAFKKIILSFLFDNLLLLLAGLIEEFNFYQRCNYTSALMYFLEKLCDNRCKFLCQFVINGVL